MYPEYAEINGKKYKINTDFRYALKCNEIAMDNDIGDMERALGIVYTLFGRKGLENIEDLDKLLEIALKFIRCGTEIDTSSKNENKNPDIDYVQDRNLIISSFKYDYGYDPYKMKYLHWYEFWNDLNNLSNSEFGLCCILNRVRQIRNIDASKIKDANERKKVIELQKSVALKTAPKKQTEAQKQSAIDFYNQFFKK